MQAAERLARGGRLIYAGAGTSGRIAAQDAAELPPTFNWPYERAVPLMAGGESALLRAAEGAEDDRESSQGGAVTQLGAGGDDVVVALAASGRTPFAIAALDEARAVGALAIGIFNSPGAALGAASDIAILLDTGPEFIAGSTRMKAGTAQKAALNCLSTGIMIRLGFVYRGKMVEMRTSNVKLRERAELMVAELAGVGRSSARSALAGANGDIKLATVMLLKSLSAADAAALLASRGRPAPRRAAAIFGNLRRALPCPAVAYRLEVKSAADCLAESSVRRSFVYPFILGSHRPGYPEVSFQPREQNEKASLFCLGRGYRRGPLRFRRQPVIGRPCRRGDCRRHARLHGWHGRGRWPGPELSLLRRRLWPLARVMAISGALAIGVGASMSAPVSRLMATATIRVTTPISVATGARTAAGSSLSGI